MDSGRQVFTVDLLERYAAKGRGVITCMAAGNDVILLGTSKGWVVRHDFGVGDSYGNFFNTFFWNFIFLFRTHECMIQKRNLVFFQLRNSFKCILLIVIEIDPWIDFNQLNGMKYIYNRVV